MDPVPSRAIIGLEVNFVPEPLAMSDVTQRLSQIEDGDPSAAEQLLPLVYDELRKLAAAKLAKEHPGQTLQATALVHEAFIRLVDVKNAQHWDSRGHFFAAAAEAIRRILVERARQKQSLKRGVEHQRVNIELDAIAGVAVNEDLLALDDALKRFVVLDPRKAKLVELRFFGGLSMEQAARALGLSISTAQRDWTYARAWLHREIAAGKSREL